MSNQNKFTSTTTSEVTKMYFIHFILDAAILFLGTLVASKSIVFGTEFIPPAWGVFHAASLLSLIGILTIPVFEYIREKRQKELSMQDWMIGYFVINFVSVWVISRFAEQLGFGISSWMVAVILAVFLDFAQGFGATLVYKK